MKKSLRNFADNIKNEEELYSYVLMERILPEEHENYIITPNSNQCEKRMCVFELGIFGISIR